MREICYCQRGVYMPLWEFAEFSLQEDHLNKQTNIPTKQTNIQTNPPSNRQTNNRKPLCLTFLSLGQLHSNF